MLYVTTRSDVDAFTAQRVLRDRRGPDGGLFVPFRLPVFTPEEILELGAKSFNSRVAEILNLLFNTHLTGYDLDFAIGRHSIRVNRLNQRLLIAECWHNTRWDFSRTVEALTDLVRVDRESVTVPGDWAQVGIRIAVLFGIVTELIRDGAADFEKRVDISLVAGDFSAPMSAWYAREMGLPIGNILCCCNENGNLWDFLCHGQLKTDAVAKQTLIPEADVVVPVGIERLIHAAGGTAETDRYLQALREGRTYYPDERMLEKMRQGIFVTVTGSSRIQSTIPNAWGTHGVLLSPCAALTYAGLEDYRARTGEGRCAVLLSEKSPRIYADAMTDILGITPKELENRL